MLKGNTQGNNSPTTLQTILDQFRDDSKNNRDLGEKRERSSFGGSGNAYGDLGLFAECNSILTPRDQSCR